ncbi:MAG: hypothetical protein HY608_06880, partial [Planctomycetes bacterium]|nr:hypothetical protein [Planctomycetota bacterium]
GAWFYADPPSASPIRHDNYHTGFILDALLRYARATGDGEPMAAWRRGLAFYEERLFDPNGAPRWQSHQAYPRDVHGSAQGILTFSRAASIEARHLATAQRLARWAVDHLFLPEEGRFLYQRGRFLDRRFTLMRWCQAWMARALAALAEASRNETATASGSPGPRTGA